MYSVYFKPAGGSPKAIYAGPNGQPWSDRNEAAANVCGRNTYLRALGVIRDGRYVIGPGFALDRTLGRM